MIFATLVSALSLALSSPGRAETRHTVVPKDTLWDLASRYYQDPFKWRRISEANPPPDVRDPHWIYPGQVLVIPDGDGPADRAPAEPAAAEPAALPPPSAVPVIYNRQRPPESTMASPPESLSTEIPEGLVAAGPSAVRLQVMDGWTPDGKIVEFEGRETMSAAGDSVHARFDAGVPVKQGSRFFVFRKAAATEADPDKDAAYLVRIGLIEARKQKGEGMTQCLILKSDDSVQVGDLLKRED